MKLDKMIEAVEAGAGWNEDPAGNLVMAAHTAITAAGSFSKPNTPEMAGLTTGQWQYQRARQVVLAVLRQLDAEQKEQKSGQRYLTVEGQRYAIVENLGWQPSAGVFASVVKAGDDERVVARPRGGAWRFWGARDRLRSAAPDENG